MNMLFFLVPLLMIAWGIYCHVKGHVWIRSRKPQYRAEIGEVWYIGINAFFVFTGLFVMAVVNQISFQPIGSYLHWVFESCDGLGKSQCREPTFFLRLIPGYLVIAAILALLRPKRD